MSDLFDVRYGVNLELNALTPDRGGINFVSRSARGNGVSSRVARMPNVTPLLAGTLSVAGGGSVLETFLQPEPYYSGRDVYCLTPKIGLTDTQKLYYCMCLRANKYRYSYGRQANRTLKDIPVPALGELPTFVTAIDIPNLSVAKSPALVREEPLNPFPTHMHLAPLRELFDIGMGNGLSLNRLLVDPHGKEVPFVSRKAGDNGVAAYVMPIPGVAPNPAGELTVALSGQGGRLSAFLQDRPFYTGFHVACLRPKRSMSRAVLLYYCACIYANRFRYGWGRQANRTLGDITLPMPKAEEGWRLMEQYIQSLSFSSQIPDLDAT